MLLPAAHLLFFVFCFWRRGEGGGKWKVETYPKIGGNLKKKRTPRRPDRLFLALQLGGCKEVYTIMKTGWWGCKPFHFLPIHPRIRIY